MPDISRNDARAIYLIAAGFRAKDIAEREGCNTKTVESRICHLKKKYECKTTTHLFAKILALGLIKNPEADRLTSPTVKARLERR
jgi:DNA-binding CsgD family transcriptional regulator